MEFCTEFQIGYDKLPIGVKDYMVPCNDPQVQSGWFPTSSASSIHLIFHENKGGAIFVYFVLECPVWQLIHWFRFKQ